MTESDEHYTTDRPESPIENETEEVKADVDEQYITDRPDSAKENDVGEV